MRALGLRSALKNEQDLGNTKGLLGDLQVSMCLRFRAQGL